MTFPRQQQNIRGNVMGNNGSNNSGCMLGPQRSDLPAKISEGEVATYRRVPCGEPESSSCSDGHLSDIMPDVAMATASLGQLQLADVPESLQLDLGDGPGHLPGVSNGNVDIRNMQVS